MSAPIVCLDPPSFIYLADLRAMCTLWSKPNLEGLQVVQMPGTRHHTELVCVLLEDRALAVQTLARRRDRHGAVTYPTACALTYTHRAA